MGERVRSFGATRPNAELGMQSMLMRLTEGLPVLFFAKDTSGRYTAVNDQFCKVIGMTTSQILGRTTREIFPVLLAHELEATDDAVLSLQEAHTMVDREVVLEDRKFIITLRKCPLMGPDGRTIGLLGLGVDSAMVRRAEDLTATLYNLGIALSSARGPAELLKLCTSTALEISLMEAGAVLMFDPGSSGAAIEGVIGMDASCVHGFAASGEARALVEDAKNEDVLFWTREGAPGTLRELAAVSGKRTLVLVPLRSRDRPLALLLLASRNEHAPSNMMMHALRLLGDHVATHLARSRSELALRKSEEFYRTLVSLVPYGIALVDREGNIAEANEALARLLGTDHDTLLGSPFHALFEGPVAETGDLGIISRMLSDGEISPMVLKTNADLFKGLKVELVASIVRDREGRADMLVAMLRDVTEHHESQEALRSSEERYRLLASNVIDVIWMVDTDMRLTYISPSVEALTGRSPQELVGRGAEELLPPESFRALWDSWHRELFTEEAWDEDPNRELSIELRYVRPDGVEVWLDNRVSFIRDTRGRPCGYVGVTRDDTERRRAEEALRESEERYRRLTEVSFDGFIIIDEEVILEASDEFARMFGYTTAELPGRRTTELVTSEYRQVVLERIQGTSGESQEAMGLRKDGSTFFIELVSGQVHYKGKIAYMVAILDITDRKLAEKRQIEERSRAELYLDIFGHDIINLTQGIVAYLELLMKSKGLPENAHRYTKGALDRTIAISKLVTKVQRLSMLKDTQLDLGPLDVHRLITAAAGQLQWPQAPRPLELEFSFGEGEVLLAGTSLLEDVFTSLLENAVKYDPHEVAVVEVVATPACGGETWRIELRDHGSGVPDHMKSLIFTRVERGERSARSPGLGLIMVSQIVDRFGGRIWVEDRVPGDHRRGSSFILELPRARPA